MVVIIFECILVALVVNNNKVISDNKVINDNKVISDNEAEPDKSEDDALLKIDGHLNTSKVIQKNCRDIQEKNSGARSGLYLIRFVGKNTNIT